MGSYETVGHTHTHGYFEAKGSYENTSIYVPGLTDLHIEVDSVVHPGAIHPRAMRLQEYT